MHKLIAGLFWLISPLVPVVMVLFLVSFLLVTWVMGGLLKLGIFILGLYLRFMDKYHG